MTGDEQRRGAVLRVEWPTVLLIAGCYGVWALAAYFLWPAYPFAAFVLLTLCIALQSSLMHEAAHGHPTRNGFVNELLVGLPIGLVYPFRRFKALHLRHHADERLTDPFDDPESYYRSLWKYEALPAWLQALLAVNNTMAGRFLIGPAIADVGFVLTEAKLAAEGNKSVHRAWQHHAIGLALIVPLVLLSPVPLWAYLAAAYLGQSIISIRTFAEHQWSERPDGRTIIVERSPLSFLFLNNNLHLVQHKAPTVAWYRLPALFRERREEWLRLNGDYVYPGYFALLKDFAFRAKEPVVHPVLRRLAEPGTAFRPRIRARNVSGLGTAPVPAQPPKE
jgi:fatty acid desaturase